MKRIKQRSTISLAVVSALLIAFGYMLFRGSETEPMQYMPDEPELSCVNREIVIPSVELVPEILPSGDFGDYGQSDQFTVGPNNSVVEAKLLAKSSGGFLSFLDPTAFLVHSGVQPDSRVDFRLPRFDDDDIALAKIDPGEYHVYTTAGFAVFQVSVCD